MFKETNGAFSWGIITSINTGIRTNGQLTSTNKKCSSVLIGPLYRKLEIVFYSRRGLLTQKFKFGYYLYSLADGESGDLSLPTKFYGLEILILIIPFHNKLYLHQKIQQN